MEYAIEAIKLGSTAVGIQTKDGVILAVEKRLTSPLLEPSSVEKVTTAFAHDDGDRSWRGVALLLAACHCCQVAPLRSCALVPLQMGSMNRVLCFSTPREEASFLRRGKDSLPSADLL